MTDDTVVLDGSPLTLDQIEAVARMGRPMAMAAAVESQLNDLRRVVEQSASGEEPIYGINTGFGSLSRVRIDGPDLRDLQRNLIRSHAAGVGEPLDEEVVRAMMLLLTASLCRGRSGVRPLLGQQIINLLNVGVTPVVPSRGSVGASGDLAPLSHAALVLIGEGKASYNGDTLSGSAALRAAGLSPIELHAKEGLAIINGTHLMAGIGALAMVDLISLLDAALVASAMAIDACMATDMFLDERIHRDRCQPGQQRVAAVLRDLLEGTQIIDSHKNDDPRVQDPYSLRAMPQVLGAVLDCVEHVRGVFLNEFGAVTDNPLVYQDGERFVTGANFHGMPLAIAFDTLKIALCHVAGIAERRIYWLLKASDGVNPVNPYLSPQPGLHSGLMIVQYTAAACCNELQTLATPASVANIPTSAGIEDYNSMGATAALQARSAIDLAMNVIAIELLVMSEAMEYQRPLQSGKRIEHAIMAIRSVVPRLVADRSPSPDIEAILHLIRSRAFQTDLLT